MTATPAELGEVCRTTAVLAGHYLREQWSQPRTLTRKGFRDFVTDADTAAQTLITQHILDTYPTHGFLAEEDDADLPTTGEIIWVVDPIDGTSNYSRQLGSYCVSIAAMRHSQVVCGAIYDPQRDELFTAVSAHGAELNGEAIQVSAIDQLEQAIIALDWAHGRVQRRQSLNMIAQVGSEVRTIRAVGTAALALAWVAVGRLEAYFNVGLKPWDCAAGQLIIREAGGHVTNLAGHPWQIDTPFCVASNGRVHESLLGQLRRAF
jgi:myo-inositol-1(or 4)-monophosphatase